VKLLKCPSFASENRHSNVRFLLILILVIGIFFRFTNLDKKVYWSDETFTSLRISGYTVKESIDRLYDGHVVSIEDLHKYQSLNSEKTVIDTITGLAKEEPQHTPLYFLMVRFWVQWFGDSVAVTRSLSAGISLLAFPCIYWLAIELFDSSVTAWMAMALIAISPFHILYAQEARPFSLWTVSVLLSSAALLRAIRLKTKTSWGIYAASLALSLYSFLFSGLVAFGQGIYVLTTEKFRLSKTVIAYLFASFIGILTLAPWLFIVKINLFQAETRTNWSATKVSLFSLTKMWAGNLSRVFFDVGVGSDNPLPQLIPLIPPIILILLLLGYAIYVLCCHTEKKTWLFILILIGVTALALILPDLIFGGRRSGVARYAIPCYLGFQLAVAHLLAIRITEISANSRLRKLWRVIAIILITSGVLSCTISAQSQIWWNKGPDRTGYNPEIAQIVNQARQPLLISDNTDLALIQSLSYLLESKVRFQLTVESHIPKIADGFSDIFLYRPSEALGSGILQQNYRIEPAYQGRDVWLWKLTKE